MHADNESQKYIVPGLIRGLKILESFTPEKSEMTLSEISIILNINRSSAFRLVQTLESYGYLNRTPHKTYTLSVKVLQLGYTAVSTMDIPAYTTAIMKKLRDQTQAAIHIAVLDGIDIVYIHNIQALGAFSSNIRVGTRWPAYATVIGQVLLASLTDDEIRQRFHHFDQWHQYSDHTAKNIDELLKKIHIARESQYLISWKKFKSDMIAAATPIKSQITQQTEYVLSISCPATNYNNQEQFIKEVIPYTLQAADEISQLII